LTPRCRSFSQLGSASTRQGAIGMR
jgi:hypothetical protein